MSTNGTPKGMRIAGWILTGLVTLFMVFAATGNFLRPEQVVEGTLKMGYPESVILPLGVVIVVISLLYVIPKTAVIGAILLTGYFGGAVATHVRVSDPLFSGVLVPVYFGVAVWLGLYLRSAKVRTVVHGV